MTIPYCAFQKLYYPNETKKGIMGFYLEMPPPYDILSHFLTETNEKLTKYLLFLNTFLLSKDNKRIEMIQENALDEDWLLSDQFFDIAEGKLFIFEEQAVALAFIRPADNKLFLIDKWKVSTVTGNLENYKPLELPISALISIINLWLDAKELLLKSNNLTLEGEFIV